MGRWSPIPEYGGVAGFEDVRLDKCRGMREMRFWKWCDCKWRFPEGVPPEAARRHPTPNPARPLGASERRREPAAFGAQYRP